MSQESSGSSQVVEAVPSALLYEMIRSFTTLARTLNLSHAVKELGSTRQTVRRHIAQLEEAKGVRLFDIIDRQYQLTDAGKCALPEAVSLLTRGRAWLAGQIGDVAGMQRFRVGMPGNWTFWLQQRPLSELWTSDRPLLRETMRAWAAGAGALESPALAHVRPYFMVYRHVADRWICVELGDESSYVSWFGWAHARSSIGRETDHLPGGDDFGQFMLEPFEDVARHQSTRYDHVYVHLEREAGGPRVPLTYQRLLLGGRFPDGTFALISVVDRCKSINITDLDPADAMAMSADLIMPINPILLKYERDLDN